MSTMSIMSFFLKFTNVQGLQGPMRTKFPNKFLFLIWLETFNPSTFQQSVCEESENLKENILLGDIYYIFHAPCVFTESVTCLDFIFHILSDFAVNVVLCKTLHSCVFIF